MKLYNSFLSYRKMNPIKEENREYLDSNVIHKMYKLSHPDLDLTMQRLRDRILE